MALISCPECKKDISDKVKSCPHCGYPLIEENDINQQRTADTSARNLDKEIDEINSDFSNGKRTFKSNSKGEARHQWDLDYFSRGSEVIFGGGIAEWYLVGHSELLVG